jgi:hypothetical protein
MVDFRKTNTCKAFEGYLICLYFHSRMEISLTDRVRNEEVLRWVREERNILRIMERREANWIGHILRGNCHL